MAGLWDTYVLQATICMRPEARSCPEGRKLDRATKSLSLTSRPRKPRRDRVACIRGFNDLRRFLGFLNNLLPCEGSSSWNNQKPGASMSRGSYCYWNCEEVRGPARSHLPGKYNTPQSTEGHHSKPQHRSAPRPTAAHRSALQRTVAHRSAPQRTI